MSVTSRFANSLALATVVVAAVLSVSTVSHAAILNGGFEDTNFASDPFAPPYFVPPAYVYPAGPPPSLTVTRDSWDYSGGAGLINATVSPNAWFNANPVPSGYGGNQFAFVQGSGTLSQTFSATPGPAYINWLQAGRPNNGCCNGDQTYQVFLNGNSLGTYSTFSGENFLLETVQALLLGVNTLTFQGLLTTDNTAFIDNVSVNATPLPSTWLMMLGGFLGLGFFAYRGTRNRSAAIAVA